MRPTVTATLLLSAAALACATRAAAAQDPKAVEVAQRSMTAMGG